MNTAAHKQRAHELGLDWSIVRAIYSEMREMETLAVARTLEARRIAFQALGHLLAAAPEKQHRGCHLDPPGAAQRRLRLLWATKSLNRLATAHVDLEDRQPLPRQRQQVILTGYFACMCARIFNVLRICSSIESWNNFYVVGIASGLEYFCDIRPQNCRICFLFTRKGIRTAIKICRKSCQGFERTY
jgi:hypothetical protein